MPKPILKTRKVSHFRITWRGIAIRIRYTWKSFGRFGQTNGDTTDHVEVRIGKVDIAFCPLTSTGYRSYLVHTRPLQRAGGPVAFIRAELERESSNPAWIRASLKARQLDLFAGG